MTNQRQYSGKDIDMLNTCAAIINSALSYRDLLVAQRPVWRGQYFQGIANRISAIRTNYFEKRSDDQTPAKIESKRLVEQILYDLTVFRVQLNEDFKKEKVRRESLLKELGFKEYFQKAKLEDIHALKELVKKFRSGVNDVMKAEFIAKGMHPELLTRIFSYVSKLKDIEPVAISTRENKKVLTIEVVTALNEIYDEVISICKIAKTILQNDPQKKDEFNFSKVKASLLTDERKHNHKVIVQEELEPA